MPSINISGLSEETIADIEARAAESDARSRSEWLRWRLRAGMQIYDAGEFDREALDELTSHQDGDSR